MLPNQNLEMTIQSHYRSRASEEWQVTSLMQNAYYLKFIHPIGSFSNLVSAERNVKRAAQRTKPLIQRSPAFHLIQPFA